MQIHRNVTFASVSNRKKVLFVEDNRDLQKALSRYFQCEYEIVPALTLKQADALLEKAHFDLVLLDLGLPDGNAFGLCKRIRSHFGLQEVPIIFLSAMGDLENKIKAFQIGADDFLTKPIDCKELEVRFESQIRKFEQRKTLNEQNEVVEFRDLALNTIAQRVNVHKKHKSSEIPLTRTEFRILILFVSERSQLFTLELLKQAIWGETNSIVPKTIEVHLSNLNRKLEDSGSSVTIDFVRGIGYRIF